MKSKITKSEKSDIFPKLMYLKKHFEIVILATGKNDNGRYAGVCLFYENKTRPSMVGEYCESWNPDFEDFNDRVTLSN